MSQDASANDKDHQAIEKAKVEFENIELGEPPQDLDILLFLFGFWLEESLRSDHQSLWQAPEASGDDDNPNWEIAERYRRWFQVALARVLRWSEEHELDIRPFFRFQRMLMGKHQSDASLAQDVLDAYDMIVWRYHCVSHPDEPLLNLSPQGHLVLKALKDHGRRLTFPKLVSIFNERSGRYGRLLESTVKSALWELERQHLVDHRNDTSPRGYGMPYWT